MFLNKTTDQSNLDMSNGRDLNYYLNMTKDYKHDFTFKVKQYDGFNVVDDSEFQFGTKAKMGDFYVSQVKKDAIVYCAPRTGMAPLSLSYLCKKYNKKLYLFMPAAKEASSHQLLAIERGAIPIFVRTPAMPTLNGWAKKFAQDVNAEFAPFGLKHEMVVAGGVRVFHDNFKDTNIETMWTVFSTGVLSRTLQIALPNTKFNAIAVARNVQEGELGRAKFYSYDRPFLKASRVQTPFDSIQTYDAKGWELLKTHGQQGDWFWNVAGNMPKPTIKPGDIDSSRAWGDFSDFKKHYKD